MFSVRVPWSELESYLKTEFKQKIICVPGDGVCFLRCVKHCLEHDLDIEYSIDQISDKIFDEICDNSERNKCRMLTTLEKRFCIFVI